MLRKDMRRRPTRRRDGVGCSGARQNRSTHSTVPQKETLGHHPSWSSRLITRSRSTHLEPERGRECRHDHLFAAVLDRQHSRRARPSTRSWRWSLPGCATRSAAACTPKRLCSTRRCAQPVPPGPASVWPVACAGDTACAARTGQCMSQAMPHAIAGSTRGLRHRFSALRALLLVRSVSSTSKVRSSWIR